MARKAVHVASGLVACLVLAACAGRTIREAPPVAATAAMATQEAREAALQADDEWTLAGRVALANGDRGGSGRLDWRQSGERFAVSLSAPITRQSWRLGAGPDGATLEGLEGGPRQGPDAAGLLLRSTGWQIPLEALPASARPPWRSASTAGWRGWSRVAGPSPIRNGAWPGPVASCSRIDWRRCGAMPGSVSLSTPGIRRRQGPDVAVEASDPGWSAWPAPAKLNLFLRVTGRRPDGYHALQTVFRLLEWGDTVRLRVRDDGRVARLGASLPGLDADEDLTVRAAKLLQFEAKTTKGIDIVVQKRIPAGRGLGGGSSDAATTLLALDRLWGLDWGHERLAAVGLQLGADVPVFVHGRNAWGEGVGERLVPVDLRPAWYLLVDPGVHAPTAALFQAPELTRDAAPATMSDFVSGPGLGNAFEPVLRRREPAVEAAFAALARFGTPRLTGSGSACFVEFAEREAADEALARLPGGLEAGTKGAKVVGVGAAGDHGEAAPFRFTR